MKRFHLTAVVVSLLAGVTVGSSAVASSDDRNGDQYAYVLVTGSLIPQKVKIHRIGTKTASPIRVYDRREIDQTGRVTTEGVLALDPSLTVRQGVISGVR